MLFEDGTVTLGGNDRTKHVARRHFFVRDLVEALEVNVPLVGTADNQADLFTKPLKSKVFMPLRDKIMNVRDPRRSTGGCWNSFHMCSYAHVLPMLFIS